MKSLKKLIITAGLVVSITFAFGTVGSVITDQVSGDNQGFAYDPDPQPGG